TSSAVDGIVVANVSRTQLWKARFGCTMKSTAGPTFGGLANASDQQISSYPIASRRKKSTVSSPRTQTSVEPDPDPRCTILWTPSGANQNAARLPSAPVRANTLSLFNTRIRVAEPVVQRRVGVGRELDERSPASFGVGPPGALLLR